MAKRSMDNVVLKSRLIAWASYDEEAQELRVGFHDGRQRVITVPRSMYENLITAKSPGWYYTRHIRPIPRS